MIRLGGIAAAFAFVFEDARSAYRAWPKTVRERSHIRPDGRFGPLYIGCRAAAVKGCVAPRIASDGWTWTKTVERARSALEVSADN